jgi:hypothetical protein
MRAVDIGGSRIRKGRKISMTAPDGSRLDVNADADVDIDIDEDDGS